MRSLRRLLADLSGATAAEYALILAIVGTTIAVAALTLGNVIAGSMNTSSSTIASCGGGC